MKKLYKTLILMIVSVFLLSACGSQQLQNSLPQYDEDTVLWTNTDGTDCDYGDWLEGDKDCKKIKKNVYHKMSSTKKITNKKIKSTVQKKINNTKQKVKSFNNKPKSKSSSIFKSKKSSSFKSKSSGFKSSSSSRSRRR